MSTIVTRAGKGSALTHTEVDANFTNLNNDKIQSGDTVASLTITSADINGGTVDGTAIGGSSASTGAFTTLSASSTVSGTGFSNYLASPPAIGGTSAAAGTFTALTSTGNTTLGDAVGDTVTVNGTATFVNANPTLSAGTANGLVYLNGSKVATTGTALVFDGTNLGLGVTPSAWLSSFRALQLGQGSSLWGASTGNNAGFDSNVFVNSSGGSIYIGSTFATRYQQNDGGHLWYTAPSGTAGNVVTFTKVLSVEGSKSLALQGATPQSGTGITFPATQSASSNANTLDDYEEGTWTPVLTALTGTITSYTSSGTYTKVGRTVILNVTYTVTNNGTGAGYGIISGFPFTANAQGGCAVTRIGGTTGNAAVLEFGGTSGAVYTYANAYPWATNANGSFSILYQV